MTDALSALDAIMADLTALLEVAAGTRTKFVASEAAQPLARSLATAYFASVRPELEICQTRSGLVDEIDHVVQVLLELAANKREKASYIGQINELRPYVLQASIDLMKARALPRLLLSSTERAILETLTKMLPSSALSYEQVLRDVAQGTRISWRGTAAELREILREVIDHLAPDDQVIASSGFQLEKGQKGATQKQKVRFILRARRGGSAAVEVVQGSLATLEEAIATLARSTYNRGSASTHTARDSNEIKNLKRYSEAVLCELLEVA